MNRKYFKRYCSDYTLIENYDLALANNFNGWHCHHRLETHTSDGFLREVFISQDELIALDMYYNRPPEELIFMKSKEHKQLHIQKYESPQEQKKQYYQDHKEHILDYHKQYNKLNKSKIDEHNHKYNNQHRDEIIKQKKWYNNQPCLYNGETLTLHTLSERFRRRGIEHPTAEAKKYLIENQ